MTEKPLPASIERQEAKVPIKEFISALDFDGD
jgi:hypothetical protein